MLLGDMRHQRSCIAEHRLQRRRVFPCRPTHLHHQRQGSNGKAPRCKRWRKRNSYGIPE